MKNLSSLFDIAWKICLLATLIWMGQSLREIADASYVDDPAADSEPTSQQMPTGADPRQRGDTPSGRVIPIGVRT